MTAPPLPQRAEPAPEAMPGTEPTIVLEATAGQSAAQDRAKPGRLRNATVACFAGAAFSTQLIEQPINIYLPQVYAKELGIALGALGFAVVVTQIVNAISQQVVGFLSDRTRSPWGPRKPWIFGGAIIAVVAAYFLLQPPAGVGIGWFIGWKIVYDFGWAAKNVAYTAWGAELSGDYRERNRIMGSASFASQSGYLLNEVLPILVFALGLTATSTYSMSVMGYYFVIGAFAVPAFHAIALLFVPQAPPVARTARFNWADTFVALKTNGPFLRYLGSFVLSGLSVGAVSITFIFYDSYLKVGNWFPWLMTWFSIASLCSVPFWVWVANRIGKHRAYAIALTIGTMAPLGWFLVDPGAMEQMSIVWFAFGVVTLIGVGLGCNYIASTSILADIADYGVLKTGQRRTASYFAFYLLATKISIAIGSGIAYLALSLFGYRTGVDVVNTPSANMALLVIYALAPSMLSLPAAYLMWRFPLTARRHAIIQRRIALVDERRERDDAASPTLG